MQTPGDREGGPGSSSPRDEALARSVDARALEALAERFDAEPRATIVYDLRARRVRYANLACARLCGFSTQELLAAAPGAFEERVQLDVARTRAALEGAAASGAPVPLLLRARHRSGERYWLRALVEPVAALEPAPALERSLVLARVEPIDSEAPSSPLGAAGVAGASAARGGRERGAALLVDDEPALRAGLRRLLVALGFTVLEAGCADEARAQLRDAAAPPRVALVDLLLPELPGPRLVAELRTTTPALPVVLMSGLDSEALDASASGLERAATLAKPFSVSQLVEALERLGV